MPKSRSTSPPAGREPCRHHTARPGAGEGRHVVRLLARAAARERAWAAGAGPATDELIVDIDSTIIRTKSDKQDAAPTYKRTFGHHPLLAICAETDEVLAGMLRAGNAHIELFQYVSPEPAPLDAKRPVCDHGITHICLDVVDVDAEYEPFVVVGAEPLREDAFGIMLLRRR